MALNATEIVKDLYREFPEVEFYDETDKPDGKVLLRFEFGEVNKDLLEDHIKEYGLPYRFFLETFIILADEDDSYKWFDDYTESLNESDYRAHFQDTDITKCGDAECDYTGGGIWISYLPVRIKNDRMDEYCYLSYDSDSLLIDGEDVPQFTAIHRYDDGAEEIETRAGEDGVFVFDETSPYMPLFNELKDTLIDSIKRDPAYRDYFKDGVFYGPSKDESLEEGQYIDANGVLRVDDEQPKETKRTKLVKDFIKDFGDEDIPVSIEENKYGDVEVRYHSGDFNRGDLLAIKKEAREKLGATIELETDGRYTTLVFFGGKLDESLTEDAKLNKSLRNRFIGKVCTKDQVENECAKYFDKRHCDEMDPETKVLFALSKIIERELGYELEVNDVWWKETEDGYEVTDVDIATEPAEPLVKESLSEDYTIYKGYAIENDFYGEGEYSVQYCGDDVIFDSEEEARKFIDEISDEQDECLTEATSEAEENYYSDEVFKHYENIIGTELTKELRHFDFLWNPLEKPDIEDCEKETKEDVIYGIEQAVKDAEKILANEKDEYGDLILLGGDEFVNDLEETIKVGNELIAKIKALKESKSKDPYKGSRERLSLPANKVHRDKSKYSRKEKHKKALG